MLSGKYIVYFILFFLSYFQCADAQNNAHPYLEISYPVTDNAAECNAMCTTSFYHPMLVGFVIYTQQRSCGCVYSGGSIPSFTPPPSTVYLQDQTPVYSGDGPVRSVVSDPDFECFVYSQVSNSNVILAHQCYED